MNNLRKVLAAVVEHLPEFQRLLDPVVENHRKLFQAQIQHLRYQRDLAEGSHLATTNMAELTYSPRKLKAVKKLLKKVGDEEILKMFEFILKDLPLPKPSKPDIHLVNS